MIARRIIPPGRLQASRKTRESANTLLLTSLALGVLFFFLMPLVYGIVTSLKTNNQISNRGAPWWPASEQTFTYEGQSYEVYRVVECDPAGNPIPWGYGQDNLAVPDCSRGGREYAWALAVARREYAEFIDPQDPEAGLIYWQGRWRTLERHWQFDARWGNYPEAWQTINFVQLLANTLTYAVLSTIGVVGAGALAAYGFARFPIPRKKLIFMIVIATIILPGAVTLIPTYAVFNRIGWVGTWLPLIVPAFFSNGYNIFLLRQFFLTIPAELDEAATIDGAGPLRVFVSIILPQAVPALTAAAMFHFFFAWNHFFEPLVYLTGNREKFPISVGLTAFNNLYSQQTNLIQAASLISAVLPLLIFFFAQRIFLQGIVFTGVDK
ncbi:MAG: carbohydrate ABC transporter permease [Chloroflexi bacterium]|nr:carbohydrate ABC transporter permease [Chloroflexota bacterium]MCI0578857.1 carbohydrate ABC transporter permease [Chloroflexota bacterium]MCI0643953.1 carbohydrate ABC transporter permease [Chloroflexota bacterium]